MKYSILLATVSGLMFTSAAFAGEALVDTSTDDPNTTDIMEVGLTDVNLDVEDLAEGSGLRTMIDDSQTDLGHLAAISDTVVGYANDETKPLVDADGNTPDNPDWTPTYAQVNVMVDDLEQPIADEDGNAPATPNWDPTYVQVPKMIDDLEQPIADKNGKEPATPGWIPTYAQVNDTKDDLSNPVNDANGNTPQNPDWTPTYEQTPVYGGGTVEQTATAIKDTIVQTDENTSAIAVEKTRNDEQDVAIESNTANIHEVVDRIETAFEGFDDAAVNSTLKQVSVNTAAIANNTNAIANNTNRIATLEDDVENLKGGVAMAIAIANAPIVSNGDNKFSLSGGVGYYEDAFALSLKSAFMPTNNMAITASVASDLQNNFAVGAGIGIGF